MSGSTSQPRASRAPRRHTFLALVTLVSVLAGTLGIDGVGAQSIDDARAEAEALESDLTDTRARLIELAEEHNRATADLDAARAEVAANQAVLQQNRATLEGTQDQLREYALRAYVSGGSDSEIDGFFGGDASTVDRRLNYLETAAGNKQQILDELADAKQRVDRQLARVQEAEAAAAAQQARIDASRDEAAALEADTAELLGEANGRLSALVAEAEARRAEEERQVALAAAQQAELARDLSSASTGTGSDETDPAQPAMAMSAPAPSYTPPPGLRTESAVALHAAMSQLGVPYVWGGSSPSQGFDCSGLMYWAYAQAGVRISRPADYQRDDAVRIRYEDLQPGDLVFYGEPPSHVGMYVGNDEILNAPQTGDVVSVKNMFYSSKPMTYGRIA